MPGAITPHDPPSAGTGKADQQAAKPRRNKVQEVVCASGSPAEGAPPFLPVADHAVSCINCLVDPDTWKAQGQQPEERGHHSVTETFRKAINRNACYACLIQDFRIAAADPGNGGAPCGALPGP